jgi:hypothetical protein
MHPDFLRAAAAARQDELLRGARDWRRGRLAGYRPEPRWRLLFHRRPAGPAVSRGSVFLSRESVPSCGARP